MLALRVSNLNAAPVIGEEADKSPDGLGSGAFVFCGRREWGLAGEGAS